MSEFKHKILIVDDEEDIRDLLEYNLQKNDYEVQVAINGRDALNKLNSFEADLILMDVMMPEMDGVEACAEIRSKSKFDDVIIAFLTARGEDYSQIAGFDAGADDYITKPIKPKVLVSRIKGLLRRANKNEKVNSISTIEVDRDRYIIINKGEEISLPKKEFELLALLISKPGNVFTRDTILSQVWGEEIVVGDRTIDVHIRKLREKLGSELISTVKGVGYKFEIIEE